MALTYLCMTLHVLMIMLEAPTGTVSAVVLHTAEQVFCCVYLLDIMRSMMYVGVKQFMNTDNKVTLLIVVAVCIVVLSIDDQAIAYGVFADVDNRGLTAGLRPFLLILRSSTLRHSAETVMTATAESANVFVLLAFLLCIFAGIAVQLFSVAPFTSFASSIKALFILVTRANYPDLLYVVMYMLLISGMLLIQNHNIQLHSSCCSCCVW